MGLEEGSGMGEGEKKAFQRRWREEDLGVRKGLGGVENAEGEKKEKKNTK